MEFCTAKFQFVRRATSERLLLVDSIHRGFSVTNVVNEWRRHLVVRLVVRFPHQGLTEY